jgi:hypothetical protein
MVYSAVATGIDPSFVDVESDGSRVEDGLLSSECGTPMYEKPKFGHYFREDSEDKHVQFNISKSISSMKRKCIYMFLLLTRQLYGNIF